MGEGMYTFIRFKKTVNTKEIPLHTRGEKKNPDAPDMSAGKLPMYTRLAGRAASGLNIW